MNANMDRTRIMDNDNAQDVADLPAVGRRKHLNTHT